MVWNGEMLKRLSYLMFSHMYHVYGLTVALLLPVLGASAQPTAAPPVFDGQSAFGYLYQQVQLGARVPGSEAHRKAVEMITDWCERAGARVHQQRFAAQIPTAPSVNAPKRFVEGVNIIASFGGRGPAELLLAAHYDSRPWADQETDPDRAAIPVPGANDGASGVAVLMEMARLFSQRPPPMRVDLVFFDVEDAGISGFNDTYCLGSSYFAKHHSGPAPRGGILLDMIGDKDLEIPKEYFSVAYAREWTETIFDIAQEVDAWAFYDAIGEAVYDDHVPLLKAGIPMVNLIDFNYPDWHTLNDLPQSCSPESLEQVGRVLTRVVYGGLATSP
jgi:hypothetical protein